jgi:L-lactate dehydrogenase complex protein LldG
MSDLNSDFDSTAGRTAILENIRTSLRAGGTAQATSQEIEAEYAAMPRNYKRSSELRPEALLDLFQHRLEEYEAGVYRTQPDRIAIVIANILQGRKKSRLAIPSGLPQSWLPGGFQFLDATNFDASQLNEVEGVVTGCTVAIAETGSIVLQNAAAQGARILSLVPDYHLCVVFASQVVETVPESFARLRSTESLPTTFISGPSATADIEMTRIKGVHGPRFFDVLLVV